MQPAVEVSEHEDGVTVDEQVKALSEPELAALLDALPERPRFLFTFLAQTGLRIGEATELRWRDIDLGRKRLEVRRRFYRGTIAPPKSRYGRRTIRLTDNTARELWRRQGGADELVFTERDRAPRQSAERAAACPLPGGEEGGAARPGREAVADVPYV